MRKKLNLLIVMLFLTQASYVSIAQSGRSISSPELQSFAACADFVSNKATVIAVLSPGSAFPNDNKFILQRSDANGDFTNPIVLDIADGPNNGTSSEQDILFEDFPIPEDSNSDTYKLRVISSSVANLASGVSDDVPMHFFRNDITLRLNDRDDVVFCDVSSFSKEIAITIIDDNDNVVDPDNFTWEWFRDGGKIAGESESSITVTQAGTYFARIPLGGCLNVFPFSRTNNVDVSLLQLGDLTITTDAADFSFCPDELKQLSSSESDPSLDYQWFKNGEPLEGEIASIITLPENNFEGDYRVDVIYSEDCTLPSNTVTVNNEGSSITVPLPEMLILLPTQTLTLSVETNAPVGSTFRWKVGNDTQVQGVTTNEPLEFGAPFVGSYTVEIEANDPCNSMLSSTTTVFAAERFRLVTQIQEVADCEQDPIVIELAEMLGITVTGEEVPLTEEQLGFFDFEWFKDGVSTGETSLSLNVNQSDADGSFELRAIFKPGGLPDTVSDNLPITFLSTGIVLDVNPTILEPGATVTLTAPLNPGYTYEWFSTDNGTETPIEGETTNTLTVTETGSYFARISSTLCTTDTEIAPVRGPEILSELVPNVITPGGNEANNDWILPAEFKEADVEITIYSSNGKIDFKKSGGYNTDWPRESASQANELIYYYVISKNNAIVKKGTITVMR